MFLPPTPPQLTCAAAGAAKRSHASIASPVGADVRRYRVPATLSWKLDASVPVPLLHRQRVHPVGQAVLRTRDRGQSPARPSTACRSASRYAWHATQTHRPLPINLAASTAAISLIAADGDHRSDPGRAGLTRSRARTLTTWRGVALYWRSRLGGAWPGVDGLFRSAPLEPSL